MYGFPGKFVLVIAGAALMAGCASIEDVERAQATADQAQMTADQALNTAQSAQQTATDAEATAQSAARIADDASAQARAAAEEQRRQEQVAFARGERG
jgi:uncharacterized protein YceK